MVLLAGALAVACPAHAQKPGSSGAPATPGVPRPEGPPALAPGSTSTPALSPRVPDITLVGVILQEGREPVALIENPRTRHQALYRVGDEVGEARIEQILEDRAVVRYQGHAVELRLAGAPVASTPGAQGPAAPDAGAARRPDPASTARLLDLARRLRDNPDDRELRDELSRLRAQLRPRVVSARALAESTAEPDVATAVAVEGGARLTQVREGGLLGVLGLRPGDVVRSVNRLPVGPQRSLGQALAEAAAGGADQVQVEIMRSGVRMVLDQRLVR